MIKVMVADDHEIIRKGIRQIISETSHIRLVSEASEWKELMGRIRQHDADILLLDINMPGRSGLDIIPDLKKIRPRLGILMLSIYEDEEYVRKAINRGVAGYVSKTAVSAELIKAIEVIAAGGQYVSEKMASRLIFTQESDNSSLRHTNLSNRELEILKNIAQGKSNRIIATELSISIKTVNTHRVNILKKLNLNSTSELIHYGLKHF